MKYAPEYHENARQNLTTRMDRERRTAEMVLQAWEWVRFFLAVADAREPRHTTMREAARLAVLEAGAQTTKKNTVPQSMMWLLDLNEKAIGSIAFSSPSTNRKVTLTV